MEVNGVGMDFVKPCARCVMTTVDQKRPERGALTKEPYATLERVRNGKACGFAREEWKGSAFFAWNVVADRTETGKTIRVGGRRGGDPTTPRLGILKRSATRYRVYGAVVVRIELQ